MKVLPDSNNKKRKDDAIINLTSDIGRQLTIHKNIGQEFIIVNIDKVKLILNEHHSNVKKSRDWINALALFEAFLTTNLTASFNNAFGLDAPVWKVIFILLNVASLIYLVISIYKCFQSKSDIDSVIEKMKEHTEQHQSQNS